LVASPFTLKPFSVTMSSFGWYLEQADDYVKIIIRTVCKICCVSFRSPIIGPLDLSSLANLFTASSLPETCCSKHMSALLPCLGDKGVTEQEVSTSVQHMSSRRMRWVQPWQRSGYVMHESLVASCSSLLTGGASTHFCHAHEGEHWIQHQTAHCMEAIIPRGISCMWLCCFARTCTSPS